MKILHLLSQLELTGAEVYAQNLIRFQAQSEHQVHVISDRIHVELPVPWTPLSISTSKPWQRFKNIWTLRKFLIKEKIEVIHCHSRGAVRHAAWARMGLPVALVTTLHGRQHFSWSKRFLDLYGEIRIAVCENVKKAMELDFRSPGSSFRVLRNPVEEPSFTAPSRSHDSLKIALMGRSSGPKGERFEKIALHSFEKWLASNQKVQLSIIAPKPENFSPALHSLLESLQQKHPGRVDLKGHLKNLRQELTSFDLILASGRIAMEALLERVPVFAIGEYEAHGIVRLENFKDCLASNFGDIGATDVERPLNLESIHDSVLKFISGEKPSGEELQALSEKTSQEFNPEKINADILEVYRAAIFKRHVPNWIPILMYHKIPDAELQSQHRIFVTRENFRKHLQFFKARQFQTLTFAEIRDYWTGAKDYRDFPRHPLILTFDDGYIDNLTNAQPLLKEFRFQAVIFLLGNHGILENTWDAGTGEAPQALMSLQQKKQLDPTVWEIGSHGFDHLHLNKVNETAALQEMKNSRLQLQKDFSREILCFAYPFGSTNERIAELAKEAGYSFAVNTDQGGLHLADQPLSLFRVNIFPEDGYLALWKKTASWYRNYFFRKRKR